MGATKKRWSTSQQFREFMAITAVNARAIAAMLNGCGFRANTERRLRNPAR